MHNQADEPDIYLIVVRESPPPGAESDKQQKDYLEWRQKNLENMTQESGNWADIREVKSTSLLRALEFRN